MSGDDVVEEREQVRQVSIGGLNFTVHLISTFENESLDFLVQKALEIFRVVRED